jgi:hypothetical protein
MEILGLVWAASLLNQATSSSAIMAGPEQPPVETQTPLSGDAFTWFVPMSQVYGWNSTAMSSTALFSSYSSTQSWLVPAVATVTALSADAQGPIFPQDQLSAAIAPDLLAVSLQMASDEDEASSLLSATITETAETLAQTDAEGHPWQAVAAVQVVDPLGQQSMVAEDADWSEATSPNAQMCLHAPDIAYQAQPIALTAAAPLQIWVHHQYIGEVSGQVSAQRLAAKLRSRLQSGQFTANDIRPLFGQNFAAVSINSDILFVVDETMRAHPELPAAAVAVQWVNNLRLALNGAPLDLAQVQMAMQHLQPTGEILSGTASWYGPGFHGRQTANGERFNQHELTAAHKTLPFGTRLKVRNRLNGKTVVVRINDRGPYVGQRVLDLSKAAAQCLGAEHRGVIPFDAEILEPGQQPDLEGLLTAAVEP